MNLRPRKNKPKENLEGVKKRTKKQKINPKLAKKTIDECCTIQEKEIIMETRQKKQKTIQSSSASKRPLHILQDKNAHYYYSDSENGIKEKVSWLNNCRVKVTNLSLAEIESINAKQGQVVSNVQSKEIPTANISYDEETQISCGTNSIRRNERNKNKSVQKDDVQPISVLSNQVISKDRNKETPTTIIISDDEQTQKSCRTNTIRRSERNKNKPIQKDDLKPTSALSNPVQTVQKSSYVAKARIEWLNIISQKPQFGVASIILSKMNTFWPWPSLVCRFEKDNVHVRFFGDLRYGVVDRKLCAPIQMCDGVIRNYLKSVKLQKRSEFLESRLHNSFDEDTRGDHLLRMNCLYEIYMQALEDVGLYQNQSGFLKTLLDVLGPD